MTRSERVEKRGGGEMLVIVLKSKNMAGGQNYIERHVPFHDNLPALVNEEIDYIQADCDELEAIKEFFTIANNTGYGVDCCTIPMPNPYLNKRVVRWYGDIAKTIYHNLR